jgi:NADP-dependent 3-hydroxy acid dehydrogenase YdfG
MSKIIVITGGSEGAGKAMAERLSKENTVIIISRTKEKLEEVAKEIKCEYETCDVSDYSQAQVAINNIIEKYSKIDCLINNAGLWIEGKLEENDFERIKQVIDVNTLGLMYMTKAVIPHMKQNKDGLIINVNMQQRRSHDHAFEASLSLSDVVESYSAHS